MANATDPQDPTYSGDPQYVFTGGRWQYRASGKDQTPAVNPNEKVAGESLGGGSMFGGAAAGGQIGSVIPNINEWQKLAQANASRQAAQNPYSTQTADQTRAAQLALFGQMQRQAQGPSLANMQAQRGMSQMGQQALGAAAMGGSGRSAMQQAGAGAVGIAGDTGQARLAEMMRAQAGAGGVAGGLRGNDPTSD